ncbi:MAG: phosphonate ABC transporter, permease protein PhnE [Anaerolineae bacterium]|nr:phosphonate ABC transporter, permease protein PhnE [Anaerolineae bacterium]
MANRTTITPEKKPAMVPPIVAGLASLILPGLGQLLNREIKRGLILLSTILSTLALIAWRVSLLARYEVSFLDKLNKAVSRVPGFMILVLGGTVGLWIWTVWDSYQRNAPEKRQEKNNGIYVLVAVVFIVLGWQISQIDLYKLGSELPDAWPPLSKVLWPWGAAVTRDTAELSAEADILVPCESGAAPAIPEEIAGEPYIMANPTCGDLSSLDENNNQISGTTLSLKGHGFAPNEETQIWWADPIGNEFRVRQEGEYVTVMSDDEGAFEIDIIMPYRLMPPSAAGLQIHQVEAKQITEIGGLKPSDPLLLCIEKMVETIFLGMMATAIGIIFAVPVSFLAAKNMMSGSSLSVSLYYITRTILNIIRSIEPMIWAILAVVVVGLGPFAGLIALTLHTVAALGKLYSEAIESIDPGPIEAIQATGANQLQTIVYAVLPQVIPPFVSFSIYRWDINVRMSTIIGLVGGGGIGFLLTQYIRLLDYRAAGIAVWFIAITVAILDFVSAKIRERYI